MSEWPTVRFQQLAADAKSAFSKPYGSAITKEDYVAHGVPIVRGVNLRNGIFYDDEFVFINEGKADQMPGANLTSGDLVLTHRGTIGQVSMIPRRPRFPRYVLSTSQVKARLDQMRAWPEFYYYWLSSPEGRHELLRNISTVGVPGLAQPVATVKSLWVPHPPLRIQKAIADVLGALDDKIAVNDRVAFTGERLILALASDERWFATVRLAEIVDHVRDQVLPQDIELECVAHYSIPAFDLLRLPELMAPREIKSGKFIVSSRSVLVSKLNPVTPRVWNIRHTPELPGLASTEFLVLRPGAGISTDDLWAVCSQPKFIDALVGKVTGTSGSHQRVKPGDLLATEVVDPRGMTEGIHKTISAIAGRVHQARIESSALSELRDTLLPKLMSGRIRVRDAERVVEEVT